MSATAIASHGTTAPPTPAAPRRWTWTREQYYRLGELGFFDGKRVELVFGEIVEMSPLNWPHAQGVGLVSEALARAFATGHYVSQQQPIAVPATSPVSEPQPDVAVVPGALRDYTDHPTVAVLVVEVADASLNYDLTTMAEVYATAGVAEYWVLDVVNRQLHVLRDPAPLPVGLGATAYRTQRVLSATDTVSPIGEASVTVTVSDLLP